MINVFKFKEVLWSRILGIVWMVEEYGWLVRKLSLYGKWGEERIL